MIYICTAMLGQNDRLQCKCIGLVRDLAESVGNELVGHTSLLTWAYDIRSTGKSAIHMNRISKTKISIRLNVLSRTPFLISFCTTEPSRSSFPVTLQS